MTRRAGASDRAGHVERAANTNASEKNTMGNAEDLNPRPPQPPKPEPSQRRLNSKRLHKGIDLPIRMLRFLYMAPGGEMSLRALKQQTHAYRYPEAWQSAYDLLASKKAVEERIDTVNGQTVRVTRLVEVPEAWLNDWCPTRRVEPKKRHKKRRPQTDWFKRNVLGEGAKDGNSENRIGRPRQGDTNVQATCRISPSAPIFHVPPPNPPTKPTPPADLPHIEPYFEPRDARIVYQFPSGTCYEEAVIGGAEVKVDILRNVDSNGEAVHVVQVVSRPGRMGQPNGWMFKDDRGIWFDLYTKKLCFAPDKPPTMPPWYYTSAPPPFRPPVASDPGGCPPGCDGKRPDCVGGCSAGRFRAAR